MRVNLFAIRRSNLTTRGQHSLRHAALACVVALAQTARHGETFASHPAGLIRRKKHSD